MGATASSGRRWLAAELGLSTETVRRWASTGADERPEYGRAVPVEIVADSSAARLVSPSGYVVEGLSLVEVATLLRELS